MTHYRSASSDNPQQVSQATQGKPSVLGTRSLATVPLKEQTIGRAYTLAIRLGSHRTGTAHEAMLSEAGRRHLSTDENL